MNNSLKAKIESKLQTVIDPDTDKNIMDTNMVSGLQISPAGDVIFMIEVNPQRGPALEPLRQSAENAVKTIKGIGKVTAVLTAQRPQNASPKPSAKSSPEKDPHGMGKAPPLDLPIKRIIAVASGKGGVGKSTVALNLASALAAQGLKTGLLDADIYGPSVPILTGTAGLKPDTDKNKKIIPPEKFGLKIMSIGYMVDEKKALIWRGPMVQSALYQLFRDVKWGTKEEPLDILIVDMPPGTGDAQLTLAQKIPVTGAIIVSTPQDIALLDARKGIEMFGAVNVPILGMIENMSTHLCSNCGHEEHIFGHGGAQAEAKKLGSDFLGEIPLHIDIRKSADNGTPIAQDNNALGESYHKIAAHLIKKTGLPTKHADTEQN